MNNCRASENSVVFTPFGIMHCGLLSDKRYNLIVVNSFETDNKKILNNICNQISELYSHRLLDKEKLVLRLNCRDSSKINIYNQLFDILRINGFCKIEFINKNLQYNQLIEKMLKEQKAALCLKLDYGEKLNEKSVKNLKTYLANAKDKENINVHCVINDINTANKKGIDDFIKLMYKIGINTIGLRINGKYFDSSVYYNFPENLNRIFIDFFKTARKYNFCIDVKNKEQNEFLRKLCKKKKTKKETFRHKLKKFILRIEENNEI